METLYGNRKTGMVLAISYDEFAENPRTADEASVWNIYTWENRYLSVDENPYNDIYDFLLDHFSEGHVDNKLMIGGQYDLQAILTSFENKGMVVEPITKYEHGSVKYYRGVGRGWDSGVVGFAVMDKEKLREFRNVKRISQKILDRELEILDYELEVYTAWANGWIYQVQVYKNNDLVDSISGLYDIKDDIEDDINIIKDYLGIDIGDINDWTSNVDKVIYTEFGIN